MPAGSKRLRGRERNKGREKRESPQKRKGCNWHLNKKKVEEKRICTDAVIATIRD